MFMEKYFKTLVSESDLVQARTEGLADPDELQKRWHVIHWCLPFLLPSSYVFPFFPFLSTADVCKSFG